MERVELAAASITWDRCVLTVDSGRVRRVWRQTDWGLATIELSGADGPIPLVGVEGDGAHGDSCDWEVLGMMPPGTPWALTRCELRTHPREHHVAAHLEARLEFELAEAGLAVCFTAIAYPDAPGVRTQLGLRGLRAFDRMELPGYVGGSVADTIRIDTAGALRQAAGYYNDPQHRNRDECALLRTEEWGGPLREGGGRREVYDWANLLTMQQSGRAVTLVKESPKCVNQEGIDTGAFVLRPHEVLVTGLGMTPCALGGPQVWLPSDRFRQAWATWCLVHPGGESQRQLAIKAFDRLCFNPEPERRIRSRANTWGSREPGAASRDAAAEENVLREIASCAELDIDALAIDDGWQTPASGEHPADTDWRPHPDRYPQGWGRVRQAAEDAGVMLDLWMAGTAALEHMVRNYDEGGFACYKIDWYGLGNRDLLDGMKEKIGRLIEHSGHRLHVSWDVTENTPRVGYYLGREFGSLHPSNRKPSPEWPRTRHVVYVPRLVLRDAWHLAHYVNLNQIEIPVQNVDRIRPEHGDAARHGHDYCVAIALMGLPLFFQETHLYRPAAREAVAPIMAAWRREREDLARCYVYPIGEEPCGAGWCGFQACPADAARGYVLVFRELHAEADECAIPLHFLTAGTRVELEDVLDGERWTGTLGEDDALSVPIARPAGFRWLRYRVA